MAPRLAREAVSPVPFAVRNTGVITKGPCVPARCTVNWNCLASMSVIPDSVEGGEAGLSGYDVAVNRGDQIAGAETRLFRQVFGHTSLTRIPAGATSVSIPTSTVMVAPM